MWWCELSEFWFYMLVLWFAKCETWVGRVVATLSCENFQETLHTHVNDE